MAWPLLGTGVCVCLMVYVQCENFSMCGITFILSEQFVCRMKGHPYGKYYSSNEGGTEYTYVCEKQSKCWSLRVSLHLYACVRERDGV